MLQLNNDVISCSECDAATSLDELGQWLHEKGTSRRMWWCEEHLSPATNEYQCCAMASQDHSGEHFGLDDCRMVKAVLTFPG